MFLDHSCSLVHGNDKQHCPVLIDVKLCLRSMDPELESQFFFKWYGNWDG